MGGVMDSKAESDDNNERCGNRGGDPPLSDRNPSSVHPGLSFAFCFALASPCSYPFATGLGA